MPALFAITLFVSALLLFWVQPMIAKTLLPLLGGTPAVWNTCMVFFQGVLLAGYAYAHGIAHLRHRRQQFIIHGLLVLSAFLVLPLTIRENLITSVPTETNPVWWLLRCLLIVAGLPFFVVSATGPLLQNWFSKTNHPSAHDPYFLYAASNAGSLIALLGYPVLLEPYLRLKEQSWFWMAGYGVFALLILACMCALSVSRAEIRISPSANEPVMPDLVQASDKEPVRTVQRLRWVFFAFLPSGLMLGVTTYLTTDIASIPLLWMLPLSLYLLTFILVFAKREIIPVRWMARALPIAAVILTYMLLSEATEPSSVIIALHLVFFFVAAMACHGRLAQERPPAVNLTEYYLWISVGGVLGGMFTSLLAPQLFHRVAEYPILIVLACAVAGIETDSSKSPIKRSLDVGLPLVFGLFTIGLIFSIPAFHFTEQLEMLIILGIPLMASYTLAGRRLRFSFALAVIMLASLSYSGVHGKTLHASRNFFGVLRVTLDPTGTFHRMIHGNTIHGQQFVDPARASEPLSYYHRSGPLGQIFIMLDKRHSVTNVAVVGLGAGTMACYAKPNQHWTYYEINPAVVRMAQNTNYFTFLSLCRSKKVDMILGDARLRLREAPDHYYGLIVLDAFSSDSIPVHLMTREALTLYLSKLTTNGVIAFHISNRCLDLDPVLGKLAGDASLCCYSQDEMNLAPDEEADGKTASHWVVMAHRKEELGALTKDLRWFPLRPSRSAKLWTDDFSNILGVFHWE